MAAPDSAVSLTAKFALFDAVYSPHIVAEFNGLHVKLARLHGEFEWHTHDDTDEVFIVHEGAFELHVRGREPLQLKAGDIYVVPRGVEHRPVATDEALVVLIEPAHTPNTGDEATAAREPWI